MCGLFPCIPIFLGFIFDQKVLRDGGFNILRENYPRGSCKTHYL